jgi:hypothetical protein
LNKFLYSEIILCHQLKNLRLTMSLKNVFFSIAALCLAHTCFANKAYVTAVNSGQVFTLLNQVIGTVTVENGVQPFQNPSFVAISPFGEVAYVGDYGSGITYAVNTSTDMASEVKFEDGSSISCYCFAFSPASRKVYGGSGGQIYIIDSLTNIVTGTVSQMPNTVGAVYSIAFNGDGTFAYFVDQANAYVIDAISDTYVGKISVDSGLPPFSGAYSVACNPVDLSQAYIGDNNTPGVYIINTITNTATGLVEVNAGGVTQIPSAYQVLYSADGKKAYVAAFTGYQTFVIDSSSNISNQVVTIPIGLNGINWNLGVALSPDGREGVITDQRTNYFHYFDPVKNIARSVVYPQGAQGPQGVAYIVPLPPKNLKATVDRVDFGTIYAASNTITWEAASPYIKEYSLYRDGELLVTQDAFKYVDKNVVPGNTYVYSVVSHVLPGVESAPISVSVTD